MRTNPEIRASPSQVAARPPPGLLGANPRSGRGLTLALTLVVGLIALALVVSLRSTDAGSPSSVERRAPAGVAGALIRLSGGQIGTRQGAVISAPRGYVPPGPWVPNSGPGPLRQTLGRGR
jgi:hypothetical protein